MTLFKKVDLGESVGYKRLLSGALPSIFMMVAISVYSVVDGFFVSNFVGKVAFSSVNLVWPVVNLLGSLGFMMGAGGAALVSKKLGEKDIEGANHCFYLAVMTSVVLGVVAAVIMEIFLPNVCVALGADSEMMPDCILYGRILLGGTVLWNLQNLFQSFFMVAERPGMGFLVTGIAGVTNIALDAILMAGCHLGVLGAGIGTVAGQAVGAIIPLIYFLRKNKTTLQLRFTHIKIRPILKMMGNGSSEFLTNATVSILSIALNLLLLQYYGQNGVSAYGVIAYVWLIFAAVFIGYSISVCPRISYMYGAKRKDELASLYRKSLLILALFGVAMLALAEVLARGICIAFVSYDEELFALTMHAFRIYSFAFAFFGISMFGSSFFTSLNNGLLSAVISLVRVLGFELGVLELFPLLMGKEGIWVSFPVAQLLSCSFVMVMFLAYGKRYGYRMRASKEKNKPAEEEEIASSQEDKEKQ